MVKLLPECRAVDQMQNGQKKSDNCLQLPLW